MPKLPMHEIKRQAALKRSIRESEREVKRVWRLFFREVRGELIGSPRYDALFQQARDAQYHLDLTADHARRQLPPYIVWNPNGYLEHKQLAFR